MAIRELEDLRIKIRVLEGRRAEDAERIKTLEAKALEAETDAQAKEKLRSEWAEDVRTLRPPG
jgi:dynactin 1